MEQPRQMVTGTGQLASIQCPPPADIFLGKSCVRGSLADPITTHRQSSAPGITTFYDTCCLNRRSRVGGSETSFLPIGVVESVWHGPGIAQTMVD